MIIASPTAEGSSNGVPSMEIGLLGVKKALETADVRSKSGKHFSSKGVEQGTVLPSFGHCPTDMKC